MFTKDDSNLQNFKTVKEFAEAALKETRDDLYLGSLNAPPSSFYDKATDKYILFPGLFSSEKSEKHANLNALLDLKIMDILEDRLGRYVVDNFIKNLSVPWKEKKSHDKQQYEIYKEVVASGLGGNCGYLSLYALVKLIDLGYQGKAELFDFANLDHVFLVLNRPENSDPNNWKTWGKECIILEPWLNQVFTSDKFGKFWEDKVRFFLAKKLPPDKMQKYMRDLPTHSLETRKSSMGVTDSQIRKLRSEDKEKRVKPKFLTEDVRKYKKK